MSSSSTTSSSVSSIVRRLFRLSPPVCPSVNVYECADASSAHRAAYFHPPLPSRTSLLADVYCQAQLLGWIITHTVTTRDGTVAYEPQPHPATVAALESVAECLPSALTRLVASFLTVPPAQTCQWAYQPILVPATEAAADTDESIVRSLYGGRPYLTAPWPHCALCRRPLVFQFQLRLDELPANVGAVVSRHDQPAARQLLQLFLCEAMCKAFEVSGDAPPSVVARIVVIEDAASPPPPPPPPVPQLTAVIPSTVLVGWNAVADCPPLFGIAAASAIHSFAYDFDDRKIDTYSPTSAYRYARKFGAYDTTTSSVAPLRTVTGDKLCGFGALCAFSSFASNAVDGAANRTLKQISAMSDGNKTPFRVCARAGCQRSLYLLYQWAPTDLGRRFAAAAAVRVQLYQCAQHTEYIVPVVTAIT